MFGNFTVLVSINVCNDIMNIYTVENGGDTDDYLSLQSKFEVLRGIIQVKGYCFLSDQC